MNHVSVPIQLDREKPIPLHQQLVDGISQAIREGELRPGDSLPSVRQWARRLGVSAATITTAYAALSRQHLVRSMPRSGYRVADWVSTPQPCSNGESKSSLLYMDSIIPYLPICPTLEFGSIFGRVCADVASGGYEDYRGYGPLREAVTNLARDKGIDASTREVVVTSGTQQAIQLVARLLHPGDKVIVEEPAYPGALRAFENSGAVLLPVPMNSEGPDLDAVRKYSRSERSVRLMYTCPTYQNPTGHSYSNSIRQELVDIAQKTGFLVFEDDYLGDLDYLGQALPTMKSMDSSGCVIYSCTFSKCLLPALRTAYVICSQEIADRLVLERTLTDICGSAFLQRALSAYLATGRYYEHLTRLRQHYRAVHDALTVYLSDIARPLGLDMPQAGLSAFGRLPNNQGASQFVNECRNEGMVISPGHHYFMGTVSVHSCYRLSFSSLTSEQVSTLPSRFAKAISRLDADVGRAVL